MRCIVFGGTGFLGRRLVNVLSSKYDVLVSSPSSNYPVFFGDGESVKKLIYDYRPNIVINCSAYADVDGCENNPLNAYKLNSLGVKEISDSILELDKTIRLIHISTDHIYDSKVVAKEDSISPYNVYAYSKLLGEYYINNPNFIVLRTNFFGKSFSAKDSFTDWIYKNINSNKELNLYSDIFFNPLSVITIENLILDICKSDINGVYNFGASSYLSKYEFAHLFCKELGIETKLIKKSKSPDGPGYTKRPKSMIMSVEKFERSFMLTMPSLEDEIKRSIKEYKL